MSWHEPSPPPPPPVDRNVRFLVFGSIVAALITAGGPVVSSYLARSPQPVVVQEPAVMTTEPPAPAPLVDRTAVIDQHANTVYVTPSGKKYHRGTCRYAKGDGVIAMSIADAIARGLGACRVCNP